MFSRADECSRRRVCTRVTNIMTVFRARPRRPRKQCRNEMGWQRVANARCRAHWWWAGAEDDWCVKTDGDQKHWASKAIATECYRIGGDRRRMWLDRSPLVENGRLAIHRGSDTPSDFHLDSTASPNGAVLESSIALAYSETLSISTNPALLMTSMFL